MKQQVILIKYGEMALKGQNRRTFEDMLKKNIKWRLRNLGEFTVQSAQSTIYLEPTSADFDFEEALRRLAKVFGIAGFSLAVVVKKDFDEIATTAVEYFKEQLTQAQTFKVEAKRADKTFALNSPQLQVELGAVLLEAYPHLCVDVHRPEVRVVVEIRDFGAYLHTAQITAAGGMPVGSAGRGLVLISGGIDSPVAAYMMAKRGMIVEAIHFVSPPYTSDRALQKVEDLCRIVGEYAGRISFHCVPFTALQEAIKTHCPEDLFTVIMRRMMMRISLAVCERQNLRALVTGESLAQVASQTLGAIVATDSVCTLPVFRPVIGMDKQEIVTVARRIGTFETSILPYEDCCTIFTPKHPRTNPSLEQVVAAESRFDFTPLIEQAIATITSKQIDPYTGMVL